MMANFEVRSGIVQNIRILMNDKEKLEVSKKWAFISTMLMMNGKNKRKEKENDSFIFVGSGWNFDS